MLSLVASHAFAQSAPSVEVMEDEDVATEEIIVWGDRFARWERRWLVATEVHFAGNFDLLAERNQQSRLARVQLRTVLDCDKDIKLLGRNWEVNCTVEDIALVGMVFRPGHDDLGVLREVDAALTGARLQLQVSGAGGVVNVDVEGLVPRNDRDRKRIEGYRQLLSRAILPFHLGLPPVIHDGAKWYEHDSRLLTMPSPAASGGGTRIAHFMNRYHDHLLVQSTGEGIMRPVVGEDGFEVDQDGMVSINDPPVDSYQTTMSGVALFEPDTGIMVERVWTVDAGITAGSPNTLRGFRYHHRGNLRMLGQQESPDVGKTYLARQNEESPGDAPVWPPL